MKILEYGEGYPKTITCMHCQSKLEYEPSDISMQTDVYEDRVEYFKFIRCPVCDTANYLGEYTTSTLFAPPPKKKKWWRFWE